MKLEIVQIKMCQFLKKKMKLKIVFFFAFAGDMMCLSVGHVGRASGAQKVLTRQKLSRFFLISWVFCDIVHLSSPPRNPSYVAAPTYRLLHDSHNKPMIPSMKSNNCKYSHCRVSKPAKIDNIQHLCTFSYLEYTGSKIILMICWLVRAIGLV